MSLHNKIMNLPHPENTVYRKGECEVRLRLPYATGHKDARHAAAELALAADETIASLLEQLKDARKWIGESERAFCIASTYTELLENIDAAISKAEQA